jgi:hypothetical protein
MIRGVQNDSSLHIREYDAKRRKKMTPGPFHNAVRPKNADRAMQRMFVPMEDESCKSGYRNWGIRVGEQRDRK